MADQQRQQMLPAFFDQQQGSIIPASPFYAQQYDSYVGMQQPQYFQHPLPRQQDYRLPPLQVPREFSDFTEDKEDKACADQVIQESEKNYGAGKSKATKRVTQNEVLMSKITTTLLCNMSTFGVKALKKGGHGGNPAIEEMIALLNQDPEVMMSTNHKELKVDTVKIISQIEKLTSMAGIAERNDDTRTAPPCTRPAPPRT